MARRPRKPAPTAVAARRIVTTGKKLSKARAEAKRQQTKDLRHGVSLLKRIGVISKKVDARTVKNTRYRRKQVRDFAGLLTGKLAAVKAKPSVVKEFRNAGAKVVNGRILVAKEPEQIAKVRKGEITEGTIVLRNRLSRDFYEEQVYIPIPPQTIGDLVRDIANHPRKYDRLKSPEDRFGFKIKGHKSIATFGSAASMADFIEGYETFDQFDDTDRDEEPEFFTIFRVVRGAPGYNAGIRNSYRGERSRDRDAERKRLKRSRATDADRAREAARKRAERDRKKG